MKKVYFKKKEPLNNFLSGHGLPSRLIRQRGHGFLGPLVILKPRLSLVGGAAVYKKIKHRKK